eukprot:1159924-Pelagomonas_calceolata.AAC.14
MPVHHRMYASAPQDLCPCATGCMPVHHRTYARAPQDVCQCTTGLMPVHHRNVWHLDELQERPLSRLC